MNGSQIVFNSIFRVLLIVCDIGSRHLSAIVECHIVSYLSHDIMLGFDWLCTCNPHIDCQACTFSVKVPGRHCLLAGLPCNSVVHIELASLDSIYKEVDHGAVVWFMLIHPVESLDAIGACGTLAGRGSGDT